MGNEVIFMVDPVGLEPTTNGFEDRYSIQLSYGSKELFCQLTELPREAASRGSRRSIAIRRCL